MKGMKSLHAAVLIFALKQTILSVPANSTCSNGPTFSIIKRIVPAIDASASMNSQGKLEKVESALREWFMNGKFCSTQLGMVKFSWKSQTLCNLVDINEQSRLKLVEAIPKYGQGDSRVIYGLKEAIKVLDGGNNPRGSSVIVVITDANESDIDIDDTLLHSMEASQVQVIVVVISDEMETLNAVEKLTKLTNGFARYIHNEDIYKNLMEVLTFVETQGLNNVSLSSTTAKSAISNDTSILSVTTTPLMSTLEDNVTTITQSVDSMTSVLDVISSTEPVTTFVLNETNDVPPTSTATPGVEALSDWWYLGAGIVIMIILASIIVLYIRHYRPFASRGSYAPVDFS